MTILKERYELRDKLGEGGMAEVYRAYQLNLEREVAIKFIRAGIADEEFAIRFEREAKAVARLNHPNIMQVYDYDRAEDGRYFMVMELLEGQDLATRLSLLRQASRRLTTDEVITIVTSVAEALDYAHQHGVIHRDIKPHNIFLTDDNRVVVMDFGVAKLAYEGTLTATGRVVGSPNYLSPEQAGPNEIDHRADIYALGVVLYQMLVGHVPYRGESPVSTIMQHVKAPVPDPRQERPDLPAITSTIIQRSMAKKPENRYADMAAMIADLKQLTAPASTAPTNLSQATPVVPPPPPLSSDAGSLETPSPLPASQSAPTQGLGRTGFVIGLLVGLVIALSVIVILLLVLEVQTDNSATPAAIAPSGESEDDEHSNETDDLEEEPPQTSQNTDNQAGGGPATPVPPVVASESQGYVVIMAGFTGAPPLAENIAESVIATFEATMQNQLDAPRLRLARYPEAFQLPQDAEAAATRQGAFLSITAEPNGNSLELTLRAHGPQAQTGIQEVRFSVEDIGGGNITERLGPPLPEVLAFYSRAFLIHHLLVESSDISAVLETLHAQVISMETPLPDITPHNRVTELLHDMAGAMAFKDFEMAEALITEAVAISPDDPYLHLMRWMLNTLYLGNETAAWGELDILLNLASSRPLEGILRGVTTLFFDGYETVVDETSELTFQDDTPEVILQFFRHVSQLQMGQFEQSLAELEQLNPQAIQQVLGFPYDAALRAFIAELTGSDPSVDDQQAVALSDDPKGSYLLFALAPFAPAPLVALDAYWLEIGQMPDITEYYDDALAAYPSSYLLHWRRARVARNDGDVALAYERYRSAGELAPRVLPTTYHEMAVLLAENPAALGEALSGNTADVCTLLRMADENMDSEPIYTSLRGKVQNLHTAAEC